jgi:threonine dehydratase
MSPGLQAADVLAARQHIAGLVRRTPLLNSRSLDALTGARLHFKCENLQTTGSFKLRGASHAVALLDGAQAVRGVATHSSGNHGAALASAAARRGIAAHIVVPRDAPSAKLDAMRAYGAVLHLCEPSLAARESMLARVVAKTGACVVHPYDDPAVMAGQGTLALEVLEELPGVELFLAPVGGGGLMSGCATWLRAASPGMRIIGVEPELADDARRSLLAGRVIPSDYPPTIADGLRTSLSERSFAILRERVTGMAVVSEVAIRHAQRLLAERLKLVVEPSGAAAFAAVLSGAVEARGQTAAIVISGGNSACG